MQQPPDTPDGPRRHPRSGAPDGAEQAPGPFAAAEHGFDDAWTADDTVTAHDTVIADGPGFAPLPEYDEFARDPFYDPSENGLDPAAYGPADAGFAADPPPEASTDPSVVGTAAGYGFGQPTGGSEQAGYPPEVHAPAGYAAGPVAPAPPPPLPTRPPRDPRARRRLVRWLVSLAVVLMLVVGGVVAVMLINQSRDPAAAVEHYLELLEEGDAAGANELVDPGLDEAGRALLDDEVLAGAVERIRIDDVETVARDGGSAEVVATISLGGDSFIHAFDVEEGPRELLFLQTWAVEEPLVVPAQVGVEESGLPTELDGVVTIGASENGGAVGREIEVGETLHVYPAIYEVAGDFGDYAAPATATLRAASPDEGAATAQLSLEPSAAFEDAVLSQVQSVVTDCVTVITNMDSTCPAIVRRTNLEEMTAMQQAEYFDSIGFGSFESGEVKIGVRQTPSRYSPNPSLETETFGVTGGIEWIDGKPRVVAPSFSAR